MYQSKAGFTTFVTLGVIAFLLIVASFFIWPFAVNKLAPKSVTTSTKETLTKNTLSGPSRKAPPHTTWILERNLATGSAEISRFTESDSAEFALIKNHLYWVTATELRHLNLITGELTQLFNLDMAATFGIKGRRGSVQNLEIIDDQWLLFSVGGYLADGGLFYLPVGERGPVRQIKGPQGGHVEKMGSHIFVTTGFGDACYGSVTYSLLDTTTFILQTVATLDGSCEEGEQFIGLDSRDRFLVAGYSADASGNQTHLTYVTARAVSSPEAIEGVIAKQEMPKEVKAMALSLDKQTLFLSSLTSIFTFDLKAQKMEKVFDFSQALANLQGISALAGNEVCVFLPAEGNYRFFKVNTLAKTLDDAGTGCPASPPYYSDTRIDRIIAELTLPKGYSFKKIVE